MSSVPPPLPPPLPEPTVDPFRVLTARKIFFLPLLVVAAFIVLLPALPDDPALDAFLDVVSSVILFGVAPLLALTVPLDWRGLFGPAAALRDPRWVGLTGALLMLSIGAVWMLYAPVSLAWPEFVEEWVLDAPPNYLPGEPLANALWFIAGVIVAPWGEEFLFRGLLLRRWTRRFGWPAAVALTSLLFGILHADVIGATIFGVVLCFLVRTTGGLWAAIAVHTLNNLVAFGLEFGWAEFGWPALSDTAEGFRGEGWWALPLGALGAAGTWALRKYWRGRSAPPPWPEVGSAGASPSRSVEGD